MVATVDGRITLSRGERLLDEGPSAAWKSLWPADVDDLLRRRAAWIESLNHPTVVLDGSVTFVPDDDAEQLDLLDVVDDADTSRTSDVRASPISWPATNVST